MRSYGAAGVLKFNVKPLKIVTESDLRYTFTCPGCSGNFSILIDRIPSVQARFRCPHCQQPMDFPAREEARLYARLQVEQPGGATTSAPEIALHSPEAPLESSPPPATPPEAETWESAATRRFRIDRPGFENDLFDRRAIRNLIRTGEVAENDFIRIDEREPVRAAELGFLKSLFKLRESSRNVPPTGCRTHTDKVAFFKCQETARPLCEECAPEKKFGGATMRVCQHCGGTAQDLIPA